MPNVMLSPNARKFVADIRGGPSTRTVKLHVKESCSASVTVQATFVNPIGNREPDAGEQPNDSGSTPPAACGSANATAIGWPVNVCVTTGCGQTMLGRGVGP